MAYVWDPLVRVVHWTVAALVVVELLNEASANAWHRGLGYAVGALVLARLAWGLWGPASARLASMARRAACAPAYALALGRGKHALEGGHNPLGACMAFTLWTLLLGAVASGGMLRLDRFWGDDTVQAVHVVLSYTLAAFAILHVAGVVATSIVYRVNYVQRMLAGRR